MFNNKIVIISNYFPPEIGAAANRIQNMAEGLRDEGKNVSVICPLPNYPEGKVYTLYKNKFSFKEIINGVLVKRYWIYPSNSKNIIVRFLSMISFAISLWFSIFSLLKEKPSLVIIQSPPLFVAFSGLLLSKLIGSKTILNVSDLWPLSAFELGIIKKGLFYKFLEKIEKLNYKLADKIIAQSDETKGYIKKIVDKECLVYRNVPLFHEIPSKQKSVNLRIVYAGLLGYAQGILNICKQINFKDLNVEFHIYGAGMEENEIIDFIRINDSAIFFHGSLNSTEIKKEILKYDIALVSLVDSIYGAVPSKIFELMQLKLPILYSGVGEGAVIVANENVGLNSNPKDISTLIKNIEGFKNMNQETYQKYVRSCYKAHSLKYNLGIELDNLMKFIK